MTPRPGSTRSLSSTSAGGLSGASLRWTIARRSTGRPSSDPEPLACQWQESRTRSTPSRSSTIRPAASGVRIGQSGKPRNSKATPTPARPARSAASERPSRMPADAWASPTPASRGGTASRYLAPMARHTSMRGVRSASSCSRWRAPSACSVMRTPFRLQTSVGRTIPAVAATSPASSSSRSARASMPAKPASRAISSERGVGVLMIVARFRKRDIGSFLPDHAEGEAGQHVAPGEQHHRQRDDDRDHPAGGHVIPDDLELGDEPLNADREGHRLRGGGQDEGEQELGPVEREDDDPRRKHAGRGKRQEHVTEGLEARAAVDEGRLLHLSRDLLKEALEHPDCERQVEDRVDDHQGRDLVVEADGAHDREVRDNDGDRRQETQGEGPVEDEVARAAPDRQPRDRVADGEGHHEGDGRGGNADDDAVDQQPKEATCDEDAEVRRKRRIVGIERRHGLEELGLRLQRGRHEVVKGEDEDDEGQSERHPDEDAVDDTRHQLVSAGRKRLMTVYSAIMKAMTITASADAWPRSKKRNAIR